MDETIGTHHRYCRCEACENLVVSQFSPFHHQPRTGKFENTCKKCCRCKRPVWGRPRGSFIVWTCWSCIAKTATVTNVVNITGIPDKEDQTFGFAEKEDRTAIYFHLSKQVIIFFNGSDYPQITERIPTILVPLCGEEIVYQEIRGERGPKALWWGFKEEFDAVMKLIAERPLYRFRVRDGRVPLSRLERGADGFAKYRTIWEGKNIDDLKKTHHVETFPTFERETSARYFEMFDEQTQEWIGADDPRVAVLDHVH